MTWLLTWLFSYSQYITYKPVIFFVCAIVPYMSFSNKVKQQKEEKYYWNNPSLPSCGRRSSPAGRDTVRICTFDSASMRNAFVPIPVVPVMIDCLFCYVLLLFFTNFLGRDKSLSFLFFWQQVIVSCCFFFSIKPRRGLSGHSLATFVVAVSADAPVFFFAQWSNLSGHPNADCRSQRAIAKSFDWTGPRPVKELVFRSPKKMPRKSTEVKDKWMSVSTKGD